VKWVRFVGQLPIILFNVMTVGTTSASDIDQRRANQSAAFYLHGYLTVVGQVMRAMRLMKWAPLLLLAGWVAQAESLAEPLAAPAKLMPDLKSASVLVFDESSESVLLSQHANVAAPIASITKLMTALVVLDAAQPMTEKLTITTADIDRERGSSSRLAVGSKLSRGDLLHLALMASENRAAHALGRNYPGGLSAMVAAMNAKARALGMTQSRFVDPTGLSSSNVASPEDLSQLVLAASKNASIRRYSTDNEYRVRVGKRTLAFHNTNRLVANDSWDIAVQKTGYIKEAGRCLVMKTVIAGRSLVIVLLDSYGKYTRVADAQRIKTWMEAQLRANVALAALEKRPA
jgi:D-alanyl-D-alanine endopeptidase (penicillin-binding protein 7)